MDERGESVPLTERERAARHFNVEISAVTSEMIEQLPPRRTGLATSRARGAEVADICNQAKIPEFLGTCEVLKVHDDGDLTIKCKDKRYVITCEGEVFKEIKERPENWDAIKQDLVSGAPIEWEGNLDEFIESVANEIVKGLS
jgi:hypothetical protein